MRNGTRCVVERVDGSVVVAIATSAKWSRPHWDLPLRLNPDDAGAPDLVGRAILDNVVAAPAIAARERRGDPVGPPVIDWQAGTATWTRAVVEKPLANRRTEMIAAAGERFAELVAAGYAPEAPSAGAGHAFQIDDRAQSNMIAVLTDFQEGSANAHGGYWRSMANVNVPMSDAGVRAFLVAAKAYKMALIRAYQQLIDTISAADHDGLDAVDIEASFAV